MVIKGVKPEMVIVEITTLEKVAEREMWWLSKFEELGIELVNGDHAERTYIGKSA
jgi:tRNA G10  N-methylase Trm11